MIKYSMERTWVFMRWLGRYHQILTGNILFEKNFEPFAYEGDVTNNAMT